MEGARARPCSLKHCATVPMPRNKQGRRTAPEYPQAPHPCCRHHHGRCQPPSRPQRSIPARLLASRAWEPAGRAPAAPAACLPGCMWKDGLVRAGAVGRPPHHAKRRRAARRERRRRSASTLVGCIAHHALVATWMPLRFPPHAGPQGCSQTYRREQGDLYDGRGFRIRLPGNTRTGEAHTASDSVGGTASCCACCAGSTWVGRAVPDSER